MTQFVYNGFDIPIAEQNWLPGIDAIYKIHPDRIGWLSYVRGEPFPGFELLERDAFYLINSYATFDLPDAQQYACVTGEYITTIPIGLSQFIYSGGVLDLNTVPWRNSINGLHEVYEDGMGWKSFDPEFPYNSLESLVPGGFYLISATASFDLPGAQLIGCVADFASEKIDGSLYVKYIDLLDKIPAVLDPKTAPNMPLFVSMLNGWQGAEEPAKVELNALPYFEVGTILNLTLSGSFLPGGKEITNRKIFKNGVLWQSPAGNTISYPDNIAITTTYTATAESGNITLSAGITAEAVYPWFYWSSDVQETTGFEIYQGNKVIEPAGGELDIPGFGQGPKFLKFAVPYEAPAYTRWERSLIDGAYIGGTTDLFGAMQLITVTSQFWTKEYQVYTSNYRTEASTPTIITI